MNQLFSDDEGSHDEKETQLVINEHYAKAFEYRKEREELERLKAKYGSDYDPDASGSDFSTDSESAESEDEHGEELTPAVDVAILRTLARIKKKDPAIYDSQKNIFGEEAEKFGSTSTNTQTKPKNKSKPVTLRQVNMEAMLNSRSASPEEDDEENQPLTHVQEQEAVRRETIAAFHGAAAQIDDDDLLIPREKTKDERELEEEEYRAFLEREVGDLKELVTVDVNGEEEAKNEEEGAEVDGDADSEDGAKEKKKKKKKKKSKKAAEGQNGTTTTKAEADQDFLINYIMNRGWIDKSVGHVPTYNEVTSPGKERRKKKGKSKAEPQEDDGDMDTKPEGEDDEENDPGLLSDTSFESLASHFEASYNHRFEEPDAAIIPSFPRNLPSVVRRQDTTRKDARERRKQRKEEELQKKREEVKRMKALKMREVKRKLELISKQGGLKGAGAGGEGEDDGFVDEALRELDLEGEWDPEKHDRQMAGLFDRDANAFEDFGPEEFQDDGDDGVRYDENGKPVWDDDVDIGDIPMWDDEGDIIYDTAPQLSKKEKKKKKKKKNAAEEDGVDIDVMDADVVQVFDPDEEWDGTEEMRKRKFNEYMDEIYGLDFNDMIGDMPTRFKYAQVQPQAYALTPAEILMATDQELNEYMSVKKYAPYRQDKGNGHRWNPKVQEKLHELKNKVGERVGKAPAFASTSNGRGRGAAEGGQAEKPKKRMGKKERMKLKAALGGGAGGEEENAAGDDATMGEDALRSSAVHDEAQSDKKSKKRKLEHQDQNAGDVVGGGSENGAEESTQKKKRKRRHRKAEN